MSVKIAVFAPIPSAKVSTTTAVKPEDLRSVRAPKRTSRHNESMVDALWRDVRFGARTLHYDSREAGGLAQRASAKAHVAPQCIHYGFPTARANDFLADFEASTLQADCAKGFLAAHPVLHLLFGGHLLIGAKLIIQLPVDLFLSEQ